jgi:hypothetical protein
VTSGRHGDGADRITRAIRIVFAGCGGRGFAAADAGGRATGAPSSREAQYRKALAL